MKTEISKQEATALERALSKSFESHDTDGKSKVTARTLVVAGIQVPAGTEVHFTPVTFGAYGEYFRAKTRDSVHAIIYIGDKHTRTIIRVDGSCTLVQIRACA